MSTNDYTSYLAHFGTKGQKWGHRYHQSYKTAPTRSGMVGVEHLSFANQAKKFEEETKNRALNSEAVMNQRMNEIYQEHIRQHEEFVRQQQEHIRQHEENVRMVNEQAMLNEVINQINVQNAINEHMNTQNMINNEMLIHQMHFMF